MSIYKRMGVVLLFALLVMLCLVAPAAAQTEPAAGDPAGESVYLPLLFNQGGTELASPPVAEAPEETPAPVEQTAPAAPPAKSAKPTEAPYVEPPVPVKPESVLQDNDVMAGTSGTVSAAGMTAPNWNVVGDFTISSNLGVGRQPPAMLGDFYRNANRLERLQVYNANAGTQAVASVNASSGVNRALTMMKFGLNFNTYSWSGIALGNWGRIRTETDARGLILTTGGSWPLVFGTADAERMRIASGGNVGIGTLNPGAKLEIDNSTSDVLRLRGPGDSDSRAKLNFGDSQYVYLYEDNDDELEIHAYSEIDLTTPRVEVNGNSPILMRRYQDINNNLNTGISAADYYCVATGWASYYDIQEVGAGPSAIWTYTYNNEWWVVGNLRSHIDDDYPDVDLVCFRKEFVDWSGDTALWNPN
jgi:hypothetical protein